MSVAPSEAEDILPAIRVAMAFVRHTDLIRCPAPQIELRDTGRELHPGEQRTEDAALELLRVYFVNSTPDASTET